MTPDPTIDWRKATNIPHLSSREIHVWRIGLLQDTAEAARLESCLTPAELERAARFYFPRDRRHFVIRRGVLKRLLAGYLDSQPEKICFAHTTHGKPFLNYQKKTDLKFSCSHSADLALIAIARGRQVGIDLEFHRSLPEASEIMDTFFSASEIAELGKTAAALKQKTFFDGWTRKEAFLKAIGLGLSFPLNNFSVSLAPDQPATLLDMKGDPQITERWSLRALDVRPDFSAALAFEGKDMIVKYFEWKPRLI